MSLFKFIVASRNHASYPGKIIGIFFINSYYRSVTVDLKLNE